MGRYICPYICDHQTVYIAYWHLYCVKNEVILTQIPFSGAATVVISQTRWQCPFTWYGSANRSGCGGFNARTRPVKVTCNTHVQLTTFYGSANHSGNDENDGGAQYSTFFSLFFSNGSWCHEGIWNNYVDIQDQNMHVIFIILLCTRGYNFLGDPNRQHKVWRKILLKTNRSYLTEAFENMLFLPTKSAAVCLFDWY